MVFLKYVPRLGCGIVEYPKHDLGSQHHGQAVVFILHVPNEPLML